MSTLQQVAALTAYQLRSSPDTGRRKVTVQMVRDLAEPYAVTYISEHLEEYEDVPIAVKTYVDVVVDAFRMDHGVLSQVEYDAHIQAYRDALEESERSKRLGFRPLTGETVVQLDAQRRCVEYVIAHYIPAPPADKKISDEDMERIAKGLLEKQDVLGDMQEYRKQYVISYKEWQAEHDPLQIAQNPSVPNDQSTTTGQATRKKRRWPF